MDEEEDDEDEKIRGEGRTVILKIADKGCEHVLLYIRSPPLVRPLFLSLCLIFSPPPRLPFFSFSPLFCFFFDLPAFA